MDTPLLVTKLYVPPLRPSRVPRPKLLQRLDQGLCLGHRLTLVSAPAGSGKTTLLSEWIHHASESNPDLGVAWLSLDPEDNDPTRFWAYALAALNVSQPGLGEAALDLLQARPQPAIEAILTLLLNELAISDQRPELVFVLDDYHRITAPVIHEGVRFLIERLPPNLHLLIATRADPPLPTFRLRARAQLTELRAADLRFSPQETTTFLRSVMELDLSTADIQALEAKTEGWIVGLQLAAVALQSQATQIDDSVQAFVSAFAGSHHYLLEYLTNEVVRRQPAHVRSFLLQTSILNRLNASLCDAVVYGKEGSDTPDTDSAAMLAYLQRRNLFVVPLDEERIWYRYHHLFADLLGNLLRQEYDAEDIQILHCQASFWYEQQGVLEDAIRHSLHAQDFFRAADLTEQAVKSALSRGEVTTFLHWVDELPDKVVTFYPRLRMYQAWALFLNGRFPLAEPLFQEAKDSLVFGHHETESNALRGELTAMLATLYMAEQDIPQALEHANEALNCLPAEDLTSRARATRVLGVAGSARGELDEAVHWLQEARSLAVEAGNHFLAAEVLSQLAQTQMQRGQLHRAAQACQEILALSGSRSHFPPAGLGHIALAEILLEQNRLLMVEEHLDKGITLCQQGGIGYAVRPAYCTWALLRQIQGDTEGALAAIRQAEDFDLAMIAPDCAIQLLAVEVRLRLLIGDIEGAEQWATGGHAPETASFELLPLSLLEVQRVALARVRLAQGRWNEVLTLCQEIVGPAQETGRMARAIETNLLESLAYQATGESERAQVTFEHCLALAQPGGYVRLFCEVGEALLPLLKQALSHGVLPAYAKELLAALGSEHHDTEPQPLVEPLTDRELEVLGLIGAGYSNKEIAQQLTVTLHTIKKHTSNIYGKLGVSSRTQAVIAGRELGLLSPQ